MDNFFNADNITMQFGGLVAVNNFSIDMKKGELIGLIGPNGAGKTTVFNMITGALQPTSGRILWHDEDITHLSVDRINQRGIARTFQNIRLFSNMSVLENVMVSFHSRLRAHFWDAMFGLPAYRREEKRIREESMEYLEELGLVHVASETSSSLPYGLQRRLEIARALASHPKLLLLDEPAAGMNPRETSELAELIHSLKEKYALTVFLIEHDMKFVMGLCQRIKVLDYGITIAEGTPVEIQSNPSVIKAYLGDAKHA